MSVRRVKIITSVGGIFALLIILVNSYHGGKAGHKSSHQAFYESSESASSDVNHPDVFNDKTKYELESAANEDNLPDRIREMMRIRRSVMHELTFLESKRNKISAEISQLTAKYDSIKSDLSRKQAEVERLKSLISQLELLQREASLQEQPYILRPIRMLPSSIAVRDEVKNESIRANNCTMASCFDYSRCPLTSSFPVFLYPCLSQQRLVASRPELFSNTPSGVQFNHQQCQQYLKLFDNISLTITLNPKTACVFIIILPFNFTSASLEDPHVQVYLQSYLSSLSHWHGSGTNHIVLNLLSPSSDLHDVIQPNQAIIAQSTFHGNLRTDFDLPIATASEFAALLPPLSPARKSILASFHMLAGKSTPSLPPDILKFLTKLQSKTSLASTKSFFIDLNNGEFNMEIVNNSTFCVLITIELSSSHQMTSRVGRILSAGAIPVIIGASKCSLPFNEVIDWSKAVIFLPLARLTEINLVLRSFTDADIIEMKTNGRMYYSRIFSSTEKSLAMAISIVRTKRLQIPPPPAVNAPSQLMYEEGDMKFYEPNNNEGANGGGDGEWSESTEMDEELGPVEPPKASLSFTRNFSLTITRQYDLFNSEQLDPLTLYPYTPFDPTVPTEARFIGSSFGFRPIGDGAGGSGFEFSRSLGGNSPREQFTIVILTYEREAVLMDTLHRLKGLPYLNKVIVIWNNPHKRPDSDLRWPSIDVPIVVIKTSVNSLNNRFIPYDEIETEAILSLDDDTHLRHDEIVFAFRVWREARDRIVGFPGRYHAWDLENKSWLYNSNHSCELSMVLTGAAFLHKYFAYRYTHSMPSQIRAIVDNYTNCEDIAMNFLASHITRKPPIKVTSRWTFTCAGCSMLPSAALSESNSHFEERHKCINRFTRIYGYNPLLNTQFRADSVLFKTRIPREKQKCFKFV